MADVQNERKTERLPLQRSYYKFPEKKIEKEINLVSLFFEIHRHYKALIIIAIIGAILGAFWGMHKFQQNLSYVPDEYELARINSARTLYEKYQSSINGRGDSYITSLDTTREDYVQETMTYYVHMDENSYINMATNIFNIKGSSDYLNELQTITAFTGEKSTLSSILGYSCQVINNDQEAITFSTDNGYKRDEKENYAIITISISYLTQEQCNLFRAYVDNWITQVVAANKDFYLGLSVTKIADDTVELTSSFISNAINGLNEQEVQYITDYHDLVGAFSEGESFYYNSLYEPEKQATMYGTMAKYALLAGFGAVFALAALYAFRFITAGVIFSETDITETYGLTIIGRIRMRPVKRGLDGKFLERIYGNKVDDCEPEYIEKVLSIYNPSRLYLIATDADLYHIKEDTIPVFAEHMLEISNVPVICGSFVTDAHLVRSAKNSAGVCLLVIPGVTREEDFKAQLAICNKHKIYVQGAIILR